MRAVFAVGLAVMSGAAGASPSIVLAAQSNGQLLDVTVTSSRLSLTVREAPLAEVLAEIGRQAGANIVLSGNFDTVITETLVDVPLDEGIRRLTRAHSVLLVYGAPGELRDESVGLTEVRVMSAAVGAAASEGSIQAEGTAPEVPRPEVGKRGRERGRVVDSLRQQATTDPSPRVRQTALQRLARQPGVDGVKELSEAAIRDPDPRVREAAIRALARIRSTEAGDALQGMVDDADPDIRELASQALERWRQRIP